MQRFKFLKHVAPNLIFYFCVLGGRSGARPSGLRPHVEAFEGLEGEFTPIVSRNF